MELRFLLKGGILLDVRSGANLPAKYSKGEGCEDFNGSPINVRRRRARFER